MSASLRRRAEQLAEIAQKLRAGKKISLTEEAMLAQGEEPPEYFDTVGAAAAYYGVSRPTIHFWMKDGGVDCSRTEHGYPFAAINAARRHIATRPGNHAKRCEGDVKEMKRTQNAPRNTLNGQNKQKSVSQMAKKSENTEEEDQFGEVDPDSEIPDGLDIDGEASYDFSDVETLRAKKLALECEKLRAHVQIIRKKYTAVEDVLTQVRAMIYAIKEKFRRLGSEVAYEVSGATPAAAEERIREEVDRILIELSEVDYAKLRAALATMDEEASEKPIIERVPQARDVPINPATKK